jgi:ribonuclease T2
MKSSLVFLLLVTNLFSFSLFGSRVSTDNILAISIQKNFCRFHKQKRECRNFYEKEFNFTLHGLWPQPRSKQNCSNSYKRLPKELWEELKEVMPGAISGLAKHEWRKHGSCYGTDEKRYFKDAIKVTKELNSSPLREFFEKNSGKIITKEALNQAIKKSFGNVARKVKMICKKGFVTELRFSLKGDISKESLKELLKSAKPLRGGCQKGRI